MSTTATPAETVEGTNVDAPQRRKRSVGYRTLAGFAIGATVLACLTACGGDKKTYDISPIFPLSSDKCQKYDGKVDGSGILAHCYVTKSECEQAVSDWKAAMTNVPDAIEFSC